MARLYLHLDLRVHLVGVGAGAEVGAGATGRRGGVRQGAGRPVPAPLARRGSSMVATTQRPLMVAHCHCD